MENNKNALDNFEDYPSPKFKSQTCWRCGRYKHTIYQCIARTSIDGQILPQFNPHYIHKKTDNNEIYDLELELQLQKIYKTTRTILQNHAETIMNRTTTIDKEMRDIDYK
jgi:hypothetical protein